MIVELFLNGEETREKPLNGRRLALGGTIPKYPAILMREESAGAVADVQDSVADLSTLERIIERCGTLDVFAKAGPLSQAGAL